MKTQFKARIIFKEILINKIVLFTCLSTMILTGKAEIHNTGWSACLNVFRFFAGVCRHSKSQMRTSRRNKAIASRDKNSKWSDFRGVCEQQKVLPSALW